MSRIFVDTGFVAALVYQRDQHHQNALEVAALFENSPLLTTDIVLLEIGNTLSRHAKEKAVEVIEYFITSEEVEVIHLTPQLFYEGFRLYKNYQDKDWGFVDCISFNVMWEAGLTSVLTFDRHFAQAGFHVLTSNGRPT